MARPVNRSFSILDQMERRLESVAQEHMKRLSEGDLKALIPWIENRQVELRNHIATEDDPLQAAKWRGAVEVLTDLASEVLEMIERRTAPASESKEEEEEDDE